MLYAVTPVSYTHLDVYKRQVIQQAIQILYPMLVNGVPVAFEQTEDALSVYLNTEL